MKQTALAGKRQMQRKDYYGGALMLLIGVGAVLDGLTYPIGRLSDMGPGFFPIIFGGILALVGIAIAGSASRVANVAPNAGSPIFEWRGWLCILSGIVAFTVLGEYGGLLPATFALVFLSALGDRQNSLRTALVLAGVICAICVVVFWWALQLQFPLLAWD